MNDFSAGPEGLEPSTNCSAGSGGEWQEEDQFRDWLVSQGKAKRTVKTNVQYAKRFWFVLDTGDASPFLATLPGRRSKEITIVALANYAKFSGKYNKFQELKKRYALKWSTSNSTQYFERFFNPGLSLDVMLDKIRNMIRALPRTMALVVRHALLTGLRPAESCESVRLLATKTPGYYDSEQQVLQHYKFSQFQRTTKRAYISYLSVDNLQPITVLDCQTPSLNAITLACRRKGIKMEMYLARKIFASHLIKSGIDANTVDMLSGRCPQSVLVRHYQTPSSQLRTKVLDALQELRKQVES